tara:strand:+ start:208 stop:483 length:276 start_codon:yes stop_codon:yes gene_type:complete
MKTEFTCHVHHEILEVGISKPLVGNPAREIVFMNKQFPNNGIYSLQGCMPTPDADKGQIELYCPVCKKSALKYISRFWEQWERQEEEGKLN